MKKFGKFLCIAISIIMLLSQNVFASEGMLMYGKTNSDKKFVTVLVLDSSIVDRANMTDDQVKYINQSDIDENGNFSIVLPFFNTNDYSMYSNLDFDLSGEEGKVTAYVSSSGSDSNNGLSSDAPLKTLSKAYDMIEIIDEIVLMDDTAYSEVPAHSYMLKITGNTSSVKLTLPSEVSLRGDLTIDNVLISGATKIYANGYKLKVTETVLSDAGNGTDSNSKRLYVYGGKKNADMTGNTDLELLGGKYYRVYGGCNGGTLMGNTNIVFGGTANSGDGTNDQDSSTISGCYVFGGGYNGAVTGKTNVTIKDSAVSKYVVGAGENTNGTAKETNIYISGGKVMNVYGGSTNTILGNCDTHVTIDGGLVESIFGGSESAAMTGNTYINLVGGEVSRRVYSGCYNNWGSSGWSSHNFVTGTTNLAIGPDVLLVTKNGLHSENQKDMGIYAGSRDSQNNKAEESRLIFLDGSYSKHNGKIGKQDTSFESLFYPMKSYADYTVKATTGGMVTGTNLSGKVMINPDNGYYAMIKNTSYENEEVEILSGTTDVVFKKKDFFIYDVSATKGEKEVDGTTNINADNTTANEIDPTLYVCVYEAGSGILIDCAVSEATTGQKSFNLNCQFEEGKRYIVKAMMWNGNMKPLTTVCSIELK